jgi:hypothetical protein
VESLREATAIILRTAMSPEAQQERRGNLSPEATQERRGSQPSC